MILTHGANSLQHGFTPKPIPDSYSRIYGIKKIGNHISNGENSTYIVAPASPFSNQDVLFEFEFSLADISFSPETSAPYVLYEPMDFGLRYFVLNNTNTLDIKLSNLGNGSYNSTRFSGNVPLFNSKSKLTVLNGSASINGTSANCYYASRTLSSLKILRESPNTIFYGFRATHNGNVLLSFVPVVNDVTGNCAIFDEVSGTIFNVNHNPEDFEVYGAVIGGRMYPTVQMPDGREWLGLNLDFAWDGLPVGGSGMPSTPNAWYNFNDESTWGWNGHKCGLLYNGAAISYLESNEATLIPGWHVPTYAEWGDLFVAVGGTSVGGTKLKATNDVAYPMYNANWNGTDDYGMSILPSGYRWASDSFVNGVNNGSRYAVSNVSNYVGFDSSASTGRWTHDSTEGIAIRLIKDAT